MVNEKKENSGNFKEFATGLVQTARQNIESTVEQLRDAAANSNLKELATGLVQTARQNIESTVEQLRGVASDALEKMADRRSLPRKRKRARSAKNSSGRAGKRRQAATAGKAKKR